MPINQFYSKRHYQRLSNGAPDSAELGLKRQLARKLSEQANRETMEKFSPLTAENALAAITWQAARIKELTAHLGSY